MVQYHFDSKAMRKVEDNEALVVLVSNAHATQAFDVALQARFLFKLHSGTLALKLDDDNSATNTRLFAEIPRFLFKLH